MMTATATSLQQFALTTTYEDSVDTLRAVVRNFRSRYGGDLDEMLSEANVLFMLAYNSWNEAKGTFDNWLKFRIRCGLMDTVRKALYRRATVRIDPLYFDPPDTRGLLQFDHDAMDVGSDAKLVCRLLLDAPKDLTEAIFATEIEDALGRGTNRARFVLSRSLEKIGWTVDRISETFTEINEVL